MRSFGLNLVLGFYLVNYGSAERGFKCFGCVAGPGLGTTTQSDEDCKAGNLGRGDQYICTLENSRNSKTLKMLSSKEVEELDLISEKAEIEYVFACAKAIFKSQGNGTDLFTVRGCIFDAYTQFEAVCEPQNGNHTWLGMFKPNPANLPGGRPIQDLIPEDVEITAELCTCFTDACNTSSSRLLSPLYTMCLLIGNLLVLMFFRV